MSTTFAALTGSGGAAQAAAAANAAAANAPAPADPARMPDAEPELTEYSAAGGILDVTLHARASKVRVGNLELDGVTYNGLYAGPVLRLHRGDLLRVRLVNELSEPTNLHFHGIRTSPLGNSDNVHLSIPPGASFTYEVRVPETQPAGLYWYHSHVHGVSEHQVMGGLSGALLVEEKQPPAIATRIFVLKEQVFDDDTGDSRIDDDMHGMVQSVNGRLVTEASMRPGQTQLWRFTNQSANRPFHIALEGHRFRIVGEDGEATTGVRTADTLDVMPSSRVDVLVDADEAGDFALLSKGVMTGTGPARLPHRVIGHLRVEGPRVMDPPPIPDLSEKPAPADLRAARIDATRVVVFSQTKALNPDKQKFFVDGRTFDANRVDLRVPLGNIEEWTVRNDSDDMHVFHIHQLGFQVISINGVEVGFTNRVDTVQVPERGEVKVRLPFTDPLILGRFMYHCHVLKHEDKGMMAQIEVFDPRPAPLSEQIRRLYFQIWWWLHGVPWSQCGFSHA